MGRKGIGKLAPFGICHEVEVITAGGPLTDRGYAVSNLILDLDAILDEKIDTQGNVLSYHPSVGSKDGTFEHSSGTTLIMRHFNRKRVPIREELDRQLAGRFGINRSDWVVRLEDSTGSNSPIELGELKVDFMPDTYIDVSNRPLEIGGKLFPVTGWVAYAKDSYKDDVMAGVRLYARNKIVAQTRDFNLKPGFTGEFKMRSYITGAINAEWLDSDEDFIRTDRQDIIWSSDFGVQLQEWGQTLLKELAAKAETSVGQRAWDLFLEATLLNERLMQAHPKDRAIRDSVLRAARSLVTRADRDAIKNPDYLKRLVRLAYAIGPHSMLLSTLDKVASLEDGSTDEILNLFEEARLVEIYSLGHVAQERVDVVQQLERLISNPDTLERQLQQLIEKAPWIIYPDWTPLSFNQTLASTRTNFENWYSMKHRKKIITSTIANPKKQPDFVLLNHLGQLEIIEIKRPRHKLTDEEFIRAFDYLEAVQGFIAESREIGRIFPRAGLTLVCNQLDLSPAYNRLIQSNPDIAHKTWNDLVQSTNRSHEDFLKIVSEMQGELPDLSWDEE